MHDVTDDMVLLAFRAARGVKCRAAVALDMSYASFCTRISRPSLRGPVADLLREMQVRGELEMPVDRNPPKVEAIPTDADLAQRREFHQSATNPSEPLARIAQLVDLARHDNLPEVYAAIYRQAELGMGLAQAGGFCDRRA